VSLTGSSSLKTREKKRIKSTDEDLVMVYLEGQENKEPRIRREQSNNWVIP